MQRRFTKIRLRFDFSTMETAKQSLSVLAIPVTHFQSFTPSPSRFFPLPCLRLPEHSVLLGEKEKQASEEKASV